MLQGMAKGPKREKTMRIYNRKKTAQKMLKNVIWDRLGLHLGGFGRGLGRDLEPLGASWVVLGSPFFTLVFGVVVKSALGGTSAGLWLDFQGFGEDFGRVWGGFWEGLGGIFEHSG